MLDKLQVTLGYAFKDISLLDRALTHKSYSRCNSEQLECLGDTVLNLVTTEYLVRLYPEANEGFICDMRSKFIRNSNLCESARRLNIGAELRLGSAELSPKQNGRDKPSILSDAMEAIIGAIYLDGGLWAARDFVSRWIWN